MARIRQQRAGAETLWVARLVTTHYEFVVVGHDDQEALAGLHAGLRKHGKQCGLPSKWYQDYWDQLQLLEMEAGACFRDGSKL